MNFSLQSLLGIIGLLSSNHLDEAEAARLLGVGVAHDVALLDIAILLEETRDFVLSESRVNAGDKQVGARVAALVIIVPALRGRTTASTLANCAIKRRQ